MISSESWSYLGASCALLDLIGLLRRRWIPTTATSRAQTYFEIFKRYQWDLFSPPLWPSIIVNYISISLYLYIEIDKSSSSWSIEPKNNLLMLNWKYPSIEFVSFVQLSPFFALAPLKVEKSAHMSAPSVSHQSSFLLGSRLRVVPHIPSTPRHFLHGYLDSTRGRKATPPLLQVFLWICPQNCGNCKRLIFPFKYVTLSIS